MPDIAFELDCQLHKGIRHSQDVAWSLLETRQAVWDTFCKALFAHWWHAKVRPRPWWQAGSTRRAIRDSRQLFDMLAPRV